MKTVWGWRHYEKMVNKRIARILDWLARKLTKEITQKNLTLGWIEKGPNYLYVRRSDNGDDAVRVQIDISASNYEYALKDLRENEWSSILIKVYDSQYLEAVRVVGRAYEKKSGKITIVEKHY